MNKLSQLASLIIKVIRLVLQILRDCKRTFDGDFLISWSRMCKEIHLDAHLAHRTLLRTGGIWNFKYLQSEFTVRNAQIYVRRLWS